MSCEMIDVYVGKDHHHFRVPKRELFNKVKLFAEKLESIRGDTDIELLDNEPVNVDILLNWVYTGKLKPLVKNTDGKITHHWNVVRTYALAERLSLPTLQDDIMTAAIKAYKDHNKLPSAVSIGEAYKKCSKGSPMRKFCAQAFHWSVMKNMSTPQLLTKAMIENEDLAFSMLNVMNKGTEAKNPALKDPAEFHCKKAVHFQD